MSENPYIDAELQRTMRCRELGRDRTTEELVAAYPNVEPQTKGEALALARAWGKTLSHNNACFTLPDGRFDPAMCAAADAAEVVRLAALAQMLPESL